MTVVTTVTSVPSHAMKTVVERPTPVTMSMVPVTWAVIPATMVICAHKVSLKGKLLVDI